MSDDSGTLDILNVGLGHLKMEFNKANPVERARAKRMIEEMLRRGYAIFVEHRGKLSPVRACDPKREMYVIEDVPGVEEMAREHQPIKPRNGRRTRYRRVPMTQAKATAVGRTAGG